MSAQLALAFDLARPRLDPDSLCDGDEAAVARALRWGRASARQIAEIGAAAGLPGRRVQDVIQHLLLDHQWPIGTAMSAPFGNYLIDSAEELEQTVALLRVRGISNLARAAALQRMTLAQYIRAVQTELQLKGGIG